MTYSFLTPQYAIGSAAEIDKATQKDGDDKEDGMVDFSYPSKTI